MFQVLLDLGLTLGTHVPEALIVLQEAFLFLGRHILKLFNKLRRKRFHLPQIPRLIVLVIRLIARIIYLIVFVVLRNRSGRWRRWRWRDTLSAPLMPSRRGH